MTYQLGILDSDQRMKTIRKMRCRLLFDSPFRRKNVVMIGSEFQSFLPYLNELTGHALQSVCPFT
ncbi:hypothetical protein [Terribacillus sp. AE2B 122]|uniref:hypothetical protein n=1 Tax=Terribacillus TaxID=459532 RepID=UPI0015829FB8|nr:hypothetical protein [Terribacillus sp. AE2B 122]